MNTSRLTATPLLSIIIVEYKSNLETSRLVKKLRSMPQVKSCSWEVIIVDNNEKNRGYGGGINHGFSLANGKYVLFLNPDLDLSEVSIQRMLSLLQKDSKIGIVGPRFIDQAGTVQHTSERFPTPFSMLISQTGLSKIFSHIVRSYHYSNWNRDTDKEVEVLNGACMMMRSNVFSRVRMFDESMKLYWEEQDLCKRVLEAGYKIQYIAGATVSHEIGHSTKQEAKSSTWFVQSRLILMKKVYGFKGVMTELMIRFLSNWRLGVLILFTLLIRTWNITDLHVFPDLGYDYLRSLEVVRHQEFPLQGIPSSIPRFSQGPIQIYMSAVSMLLVGFHPYALPVISILITTIGVALIYLTFIRLFQPHISFLLAGLLAVMPGLVHQARTPYYLHILQLTIPLVLYIVSREKSNFKLVGFSLGLVFQSVLSAIPLVLVWLPLLMIQGATRILRTAKYLLFGFSIGIAPQLVHQAITGCKELCLLPVWGVYKVATFFITSISHGSMSILERLPVLFHTFLPALEQLFGGAVEAVLFLLAVVLGAIYGFRSRSRIYWLACTGFFAQLIAILILGVPSEAYLPPLAILGVVLIGFLINRYQHLVLVLFLSVLWLSYVSLQTSSYNTLANYHHMKNEILTNLPDQPMVLIPVSEHQIHATHLNYLEYLLLLHRHPVRNTTRYMIEHEVGVDLENTSIILYN